VIHGWTIFISALLALLGPADDEAAYTRTINKRVDDIIAVLDISDASKSQRVHEILVSQYRALRDWHDANNPKGRAADKQSLKSRSISQQIVGRIDA
jgi:hypothetical protein